MKRFFCFLTVGVICGVPASVWAGPYLQIQFGPSWPGDICENAPEGRRVALEAGGKAGSLFGDVAALGLAVDVLWNKSIEDSTWEEENDGRMIQRVEENKVERWIMFPASFFVTIDPLPGLIVRPAVTGQIGLNMMVYANREWIGTAESGDWQKTSDSGFYPGLYGKLSFDAIANLGTDAVGAMLGLSYQWCRPRRRVEDSRNVYTRKDMSGVGIHAGLRFSVL
ncbi:MAG: hypothetical protein GF344_10935 [Chitinivibrionales bacterium]|nr:hypothetical protein [Chitinivibrionales bacterium]MBD3357318.1 hypothetical protein [Chitinivibrionales bacterium]